MQCADSLVYYIHSTGQGAARYRGRVPLFSEKQLLYEGYHTHKPGSFLWPFSFTLPKNPDVATVHQSKHQWKEKGPFLSTSDYIGGHAIPPTFRMRRNGFGFSWHAYVEYVLKVDIREANNARMVLPPSLRKAVLPILVRDVEASSSNVHDLPFSMQFAIPEFLPEKSNPRTEGHPLMSVTTSRHTIRSRRLDGWTSKKDSTGKSMSFSNSIRDRTLSIFQPSNLPRYTFDFIVTLPREIRLLEEGRLPIFIQAMPIETDDLTTVQPDSFPEIHINNVSLDLTATTHIRFKYFLGPSQSSKYDIKLLDQHPVGHKIHMNHARKHESRTDHGTNHPSQASFDLRRLPGLSPTLVAAKLGPQTEKPLASSFNTYIIAREYTLTYRFELDVAGERIKVTNTEKLPVKVLPPNAANLQAILEHGDATRAEIEPDEEGENDSDNISEGKASSAADEKSKSKISSRLLQRRTSSHGSKQIEAEAEAAANRSSVAAGSEERTTGHEVGDIHFLSGEQLPGYQRNPTEFGYQHEIIERPPRYEQE